LKKLSVNLRVLFCFFSILYGDSVQVFAQTKPSSNQTTPLSSPLPKTAAKKLKMTIPEAKELCKKEGKEGDDLIKCIEEKQNQ
jgi:hypothetical protein